MKPPLYAAIDCQDVLWAVAGSEQAAMTKAYTATGRHLPRPDARHARSSLRVLACAPCVKQGDPAQGTNDLPMADGWNVGRLQWIERDGKVHADDCACDSPGSGQ